VRQNSAPQRVLRHSEFVLACSTPEGKVHRETGKHIPKNSVWSDGDAPLAQVWRGEGEFFTAAPGTTANS